ncbi:MAG: redoxin domain-containing protein [Gracilimonas sp.]|uniref:peroxiredoxin n=1 Tax=Gracilimonas sp. TaxID=1974203 RepID=UPI0019AD79EE|nr:redoxin domain-containing protein [Gracilimonas sp.]MBD3617004.1 redoxin domain-containing protein [Gracilimonas sp.]
MIETGAKADFDFTIKAVQNGEEKKINFKDLLDKPTIVSVYMKNNTSGCDRQTKDLADEAEWFADKGYNLVAISKDTCGSHKRYAKKQGIDFTLVSDPEYKFGEATDSIVQKKMFGNEYEAPSRSAFVIDTDGTILGIVEKVNTKDHAGELKELVEHLK